MRGLVMVSLASVLGMVPQACRRPEVMAPQQPPDPDSSHGHAAAQLTFSTQPPAGVLANAVISPAIQVTVKDAAGNAVHGGSVTITLGDGPTLGAILSGTLEQNIVDGVARFADLRLDRPGRDYTLQATAGPAQESSRPFAIVGPATQVAFVAEPPASVEAGVVITPAVQVAIQDALGSTVPNATDTVAVALAANPSGARLLGGTKLSAVDGLATFADLAVDRPGSGFTLAGTAASLAGATSTPVTGYVTFASLDAGVGESCGVTTRGAGYCWGDDYWGQLGAGVGGYPNPDYRTSPVPVAGGLSFTTISLSHGGRHACGVSRTGAGYCWGFGSQSQTGTGRRTQNTPFNLDDWYVNPYKGLRFMVIGGGAMHTCSVATDHAAYCWGGDHYNGTLGLGRIAFEESVGQVVGGLSFTTLTAGAYHNCALTSDGSAYCWGANSEGPIGDGTSGTYRNSPVPVAGGLRFIAISAGEAHTCGLTLDGSAYCWGRNTSGQVGDGTTTQQLTPVPVAGGLRFTTISTGSNHTCGVTLSGRADCWGANAEGRLGDGTTMPQSTPVAVAGGLSFTTIRGGDFHTCGLTTSNGAYCWGANNGGQLGDGTTNGSLTPVPVVGSGGGPASVALRADRR